MHLNDTVKENLQVQKGQSYQSKLSENDPWGWDLEAETSFDAEPRDMMLMRTSDKGDLHLKTQEQQHEENIKCGDGD